MKQADLEKARAEVDPEERAFRDLMGLGRQYLGIVLLAEKFGEAATLKGVMEAARRGAQEAQERLAELDAAVGRAESEEAGRISVFDAARTERERVLASVDQQIRAAETRATEIMTTATRRAEEIVLVANESARSVAIDAQASAAGIVQAATEEARNITNTASEWAAESKRAVAANQATLRDLEKAAAAAEKRIQAARDTIARMVSQ